MSFASLFAPRIESYADLQLAAMCRLQRRRRYGSSRRRRASLRLPAVALALIVATAAGAFVRGYFTATADAGGTLGPHSPLQGSAPATVDRQVLR